MWFGAIANAVVQGGTVDAVALLRRVGSHFLLTLEVSGSVWVLCDRCLQPLTMPVASDNTMEVQLGEQDEEDEHLLMLDERRPVLDLSWLAYEQVALTLPLRHVHDEGECSGDVAERLQQFADEAETAEQAETETDPRWDKLKSLTDSTNNE